MQASYHNHTRWCKHATGEIEDYIEVAIKANLKVIGISEHVPLPDDFDPRRISWDEFPMYNEALDIAIEKYKGKIEVIKGFECEFYPEFLDTFINFKEKFGYQLLILGHHRCDNRRIDMFLKKGHEGIQFYGKEVCEGLKTGIFKFLAHPDVVMHEYRYGFDDVAKKVFFDIFSTCERLNIPIEFNVNGLRGGRGYPNLEIFEFSKQFSLQYLLGSDAHEPSHVFDDVVIKAEGILDSMRIKVTDFLSF